MHRVLLSLLVAISTSFAAASKEERHHGVGASPLTFFIVSEANVEGGRFVDVPALPKLGYIKPAPDLLITEIESVSSTTPPAAFMVDQDGKKTSLPRRPAVRIVLRAAEVARFSDLTERAAGKRLLIMLGDQPLIAPMVHARITTNSILITLGTDADEEKIRDALKLLISKKNE